MTWLLVTVGLLAMETFLLVLSPSPLIAACTVAVACFLVFQVVLLVRTPR